MTQKEAKSNVHAKTQPKLAAKSYEILKELYPDKQMSYTDLAKKLRDSTGNVSRTINSMKKDSLIMICEEKEETKGGRPKKNCSLTKKGQQIVEIFKETVKPGLTEDQITTLVELMEDKMLSSTTREVAAGTLSDHASSIHQSLLENQKIKDIIEKTISNSLIKKENIEKSTRSLLSAMLPYIMQNQKATEWFYKNLHDAFLKIAQDPRAPKSLREYAIITLSRTTGLSNNPDAISKTIDTLLDLYFNNQDISDTVKTELPNEPKLQLQIIDKLRQQAKNETKKTAAEALLQTLIKNWWNNDLSRAAANA